jgi:hypothetical protein
MQRLLSASIVITLLILATILVFGGHPLWALLFVLLTSVVQFPAEASATNDEILEEILVRVSAIGLLAHINDKEAILEECKRIQKIYKSAQEKRP